MRSIPFITILFFLSITLTDAQKKVFDAKKMPVSQQLLNETLDNCEKCIYFEKTKNKKKYRNFNCNKLDILSHYILDNNNYKTIGQFDTLDNSTSRLLLSFINSNTILYNLQPSIEIYDRQREVLASNAGKMFDAYIFDEKSNAKKTKLRQTGIKLSRRQRVVFFADLTLPKVINEGEGIVKITFYYKNKDRIEVAKTITQNVYLKN